ncbi:type IV pilus biogenesis protein PilM [Halomonas halocynthiae]|uniref:type IV pilus biogenesis protein PilM n=1 Tax=Halomonas halocynthiae TaxID=176290 RepID=UPI000406C63A|nr:type IV pilus assembly protein PilM [Halomonas halocynthiae]
MRLHGSGNGLLGVDITSSAVRLVELKRMTDGHQLASCAVCPLAEGAVVERRISRSEEVAQVLSQAVRQAQPAANRVVIALPSSAIISKTIELPLALDDEEIEALVLLQAEQHFPFPPHDVAFDFQRLGAAAQTTEHQKVLLVACRHQDVSQLSEIVTQAGLVTAAVDAEPFVIERALALQCQQLTPTLVTKKDGVAFVDVGSRGSSFHVFHDGRMAYSRHMTLSKAAPAPQLLQSKITDNAVQGNRAFYHHDAVPSGLEGHGSHVPAGTSDNMAEAVCDDLAEQIERAQQLYYTTHSQAEISGIFLAGDPKLLARLEVRLSELCSASVIIVNPFSGMSISENIAKPYLQAHSPELLIACGLAAKEGV